MVSFKNRLGPYCILGTWLTLFVFSCAKPSLVNKRQAAMQEAIESYLGTPYKFGGSSYGGIDCSGLIMRVFYRAGVDLPRTTWEQFGMGKMVNFRDLRFGDVLFFKSPSKGQERESLHAGIFMGEGRFVHASKSRGVIVDSSYKNYWRKLFLVGRRYD